MTVARLGRSLPVLLALGLGLVWAWWAWRKGAYFADGFYQGALVLLALLAVLLLSASWPGRLRGAPLVALLALLGLGAWTLASILWTPTRDSAIQDAHHIAAYAAAFSLGLWLALMAARRWTLGLLPVAVAGGVVAIATTAGILVGDDARTYLDQARTLQLPIGYRNGNAAFFLIGFWGSLTLAASSALDWRARAVLAGSATLSLGLAVLCQSRGSALAFAAAALVYLLAAPARLRALAYLGLVSAPAAAALPWLLEVFADGESRRAAAPLLVDAALAASLAAAASIVLALVATRLVEPGVRRVGVPSPRVPRWVAPIAASLVAVVGLAVVVVDGTAVDWLDQKVEQASREGEPELEGTRFSVNVQTNRYDFWRVSLADARESPLRGEGAGGFAFSYLLDRESQKTPQDPHSVEALMLSELGLVGLGLFGLFVGASSWCVVRARRVSGEAAVLSAGALTVGAYWLVQASVDWFWNYPALTAPVVALVGAACAPAILARDPGARSAGRRSRLALAALVAAVAVSFVPVLLSARWLDRGQSVWRSDLSAAYEDLERAALWNPLAEEPLLIEGVIAQRSGDRDRAIRRFRGAVSLEPRNWAAHYFLGRAMLARDPSAALRSLRRARELNPLGEAVRGPLARARQRAGSERSRAAGVSISGR